MSVERSELNVERSAPRGAVFLSYASQDAEAVKRICEALRASGVEVWFDQNELTGGDAWDQKIRKQIRECALFVPIISAATQARREGYFRIEWKLAAQRTHAIADGTPFLLPIVIDATRDDVALVPEEFRAVQWTRLPAGETNAVFCAKLKKLLAGEEMDVGQGRRTPPSSDARADPAGFGDPALQPKRAPSRPWLVPSIIALTAAVVLALWQPWRGGANPPASPATSAPAAATTPTEEIAQIRSKLRPDEWTRANFDAFTPTVDRLIQAYPENGDAWALRSIANSLLVIRNLESGTAPLEAGKAAADRALRLAPNSPLAELALGMHLVAMISRGSDVQAPKAHIERGLAGLPTEPLTRYGELCAYWLGYQFEGADKTIQAWLTAEPKASFPAWIAAQSRLVRRQPAEAVKWAEQASIDPDITGVRAFVTMFEARYYLQADLAAARAAVDRISASQRTVHRVLAVRWLLAMAEGHYDLALQELARTPEAILRDRIYHGPKALFAGFAHDAAGRTDAARAQFRESEQLLRQELARDSDNQELRAVLALNLACLGRADDARGELAAVEPLLNGRAPSVYSGQVIALIAQTHGVLGEIDRMIPWLRRMLGEPSQLPFTPASLRLDSRFGRYAADPRVQTLLKEFAKLDQPAVNSAPSDEKAIAVLAFDNRSDDKDAEYFSDGISEELINALGRVPGLTVRGRTSAFFFKGKNAAAQEIGEKLSVAYLVRGSVRKDGNKVRITAQLSRAATDEVVWSSEPLVRELKDVWAVQDEIAGLIAKNLSLKLGKSTGARSVDPEAYRLYLEGRRFWSLRNFEAFDRAETAFKKAVTLEPESALMRAGLAELYATRGVYRALAGKPFAEDMALGAAEADRALALDPENAQVYAAPATIALVRSQFPETERLLRKALALAPNDAAIVNRLGDLMMRTGRLDAAVENYQRAAQLDPLSLFIVRDVVRVLLYARRYEECVATLTRFEAAAGRDINMTIWRAHALVQLEKVAQATAEMRTIFPAVLSGQHALSPVTAAEFVRNLREAGCEAESEALAKQLLASVDPESYLPAMVLAARGRFDEAIPKLKEFPGGAEDRLFWSAVFDDIREDPRFTRKVAELPQAEDYRVARETLARMLKEQATKK